MPPVPDPRPAAGAPAGHAAPNILWICTDQQRWDTLGCYGNSWVQTPHLDALAGSGVRFDQAYCQSTVCMPSRSSFLTGRYPRVTGCAQNGRDIDSRELLLPRLLRDRSGYVCGYSGKLHITRKDGENGVPPFDSGYDEIHWSPHLWPEFPHDQYRAWLSKQGQEFHHRPVGDRGLVLESMPEEFSQNRWCADRAIDFLARRGAANSPWMFSVNFFQPHYPFEPTAADLARYVPRLGEIPAPNFDPGELANKPGYQLRQHRSGAASTDVYGRWVYPEMSLEEHRLVRAAYWAMIDGIDREVGRMVAALDATGQRRRTIVLFMSDHGELLGDHGNYLKGPYLYDPSVRVPLIFSAPGAIAPDRVSPALVELVDLTPTLLEAAGVSDKGLHLQGRSLWPMLRGEAPLEKHKDEVVCEFTWVDGSPKFDAGSQFMLRDHHHKIVISDHEELGELYDMAAEPLERENLWNDPKHRALRDDLMVRVAKAMWRTTAAPPAASAGWG